MTKRENMFQDIVEGIRTQPGRIGLSFLAVAIGVASLTVLISLLSGLNERSEMMIRELGVNVFGLHSEQGAVRGHTRQLEQRHVQYVRSNIPDSIVSGVRRYSVSTHGTDLQLTVLATDEHLRKVRQWKVLSGRFLDAEDIKNGERSAVISHRLSEMWNWHVGNTIMIGNTPFTVVGIVDAGGSAIDSSSTVPGMTLGERAVFVPISVQPQWLTGRRKPGARLNTIFVRVPSEEDIEAVILKTRNLISHPDYRLDNSPVWIVPETVLSGIRRLQTTVKLTVGSIALLCLILGGTTLMSLMTADVRQRVTEIGLRRALGATSRDIALLFISEAMIVTFAAGLTGTIAMHILLIGFRGSIALPLQVGLVGFLLPVLAAVVLGAVFSFVPARAAARLAPSEALRNE